MAALLFGTIAFHILDMSFFMLRGSLLVISEARLIIRKGAIFETLIVAIEIQVRRWRRGRGMIGWLCGFVIPI